MKSDFIVRFLNLGTTDMLGQIILCCGTVLCIVGSLAASLGSNHLISVASPAPVKM